MQPHPSHQGFLRLRRKTGGSEVQVDIFRGIEGMDYAGREIKVIPNAGWVWNADGSGLVRMEILYLGGAPAISPPGLAPVLHFLSPVSH